MQHCDFVQQIAWILMFADDVGLITENEQQMQHKIQQIDCTFAAWGLDMGLKKT